MKYDAIIIGSGQGGNPLAYHLAISAGPSRSSRKSISAARASTPAAPHQNDGSPRAGCPLRAKRRALGRQRIERQRRSPENCCSKDEVVLSFRSGQQKQVDKRSNFVSIAATPVLLSASTPGW